MKKEVFTGIIMGMSLIFALLIAGCEERWVGPIGSRINPELPDWYCNSEQGARDPGCTQLEATAMSDDDIGFASGRGRRSSPITLGEQVVEAERTPTYGEESAKRGLQPRTIADFQGYGQGSDVPNSLLAGGDDTALAQAMRGAGVGEGEWVDIPGKSLQRKIEMRKFFCKDLPFAVVREKGTLEEEKYDSFFVLSPDALKDYPEKLDTGGYITFPRERNAMSIGQNLNRLVFDRFDNNGQDVITSLRERYFDRNLNLHGISGVSDDPNVVNEYAGAQQGIVKIEAEYNPKIKESNDALFEQEKKYFARMGIELSLGDGGAEQFVKNGVTLDSWEYRKMWGGPEGYKEAVKAGEKNDPELLAVIQKSNSIWNERVKLINPLDDKIESLKKQTYQELFGKRLNTPELFFKAITGYDFPEGCFEGASLSSHIKEGDIPFKKAEDIKSE